MQNLHTISDFLFVTVCEIFDQFTKQTKGEEKGILGTRLHSSPHMKAIVHTKNKFLHSLGDKHTKTNDADFLSLKTTCLAMLQQQKAVYKNLVKQEPHLKHISLGGLCSQLRRGGCEGDPMFCKYESTVSHVDRLLLDHEVFLILSSFPFLLISFLFLFRK